MWKKFKKFYKYNRIYCILMMICLFCFLLMGTGMVIYFVNQTSTSKYGNSRLKDIEKYNTEEVIKNLESGLIDSKILEKSVRIQGKIIYIQLTVDKTSSNEDIQTICTSVLSTIGDKEKNYFDMQFIAEREGFAAYMGSKSHNKTAITWGNYSFEETTTTTTKAKKK